MKLGLCDNLAPQYCGSFDFLKRIGLVEYILALPPTIREHNVFHVSFLEKYINDSNHVID
jgi:hypothetical protein